MPNPHKQIALMLLALLGILAPAVQAQCDTSALKTCTITLHGEGAQQTSGSCSSDEWRKRLCFTRSEPFSDGDKNGWSEVVMALDLDPALGCSCARFRVHFGQEPQGWAMNISDSPSCDGGGGDDWDTEYAAEIYVRDSEGLVIQTTAGPSTGGDHDPILELPQPRLAGAMLQLEVCNQTIQGSIQRPGEKPSKFKLTSINKQILFAIEPPPKKPEYETPDATIYAAFNRVVHTLNGTPATDRYGLGVERVEIELIP